ncbi:MAG: hypothetical protein DHS20C15_16510 [Planctomycetota bacterium]|nr:MAG: hypothetical protein DHS20C15_16510 [Planctomycetota bacterium]
MKATRGVLLLIVGLLALAAAVWWWSRDPAPTEAAGERPPYALPVTLAEVKRDTLRPSLTLTGNVRAARWARLAFERAGVLEELLVTDAQEVQAGDVLARLDDGDAQLNLQRAEADLNVARRAVELLEAGARSEVVRRLAAELEAARASQDLAQQEVDRRTTLAQVHDVSQSEMDRVLATLREATALSAAATERHAEAVAGTRNEDLAIATAQRQVAEAELQRARRELAKTVLSAPWDGTVVRRLGSEGDYLQPGEELVELTDREHLEVHLEVPASSALRVSEGAAITIRSDAAPLFEMRAQIDAAVPSADMASRNFRALARVLRSEQPSDVLRPGMFVRVELELEPRENSLVVPSDAVRLTENGYLIARADRDGERRFASWVFVELIGQAGGFTAVRPLDAELEAGDRVVVTGVDLSYDGVTLLPLETDTL